jgi:hypothetical protein
MKDDISQCIKFMKFKKMELQYININPYIVTHIM